VALTNIGSLLRFSILSYAVSEKFALRCSKYFFDHYREEMGLSFCKMRSKRVRIAAMTKRRSTHGM
jgi:hypothetical protein